MEPVAGEAGAPLGLIIAIPVFLCINVGLAVIGARWMNRLSHDTSEDVLTAHYLGGRSFGPWLSLGTMFASMFSGFTVIGIPNGAYKNGWVEIERISYVFMLAFVFAGAAPRLRKASLVRNHQTPSDFITDMFQSQLLRYAIIILQLIAQFIWMTSNVLSLRNGFNGAFHLGPNNPWFTIGVVVFILVSEWFGGLSTVALTDTVQGIIMLFGAVCVTCVIKHFWGGWVALDPLTFPKPEFYQTPSRERQWMWIQLNFLTISQAFYPVSIQRIYAASSLEGVRMGAISMFAAPWIATISAVFIGTMGVQIIGESCANVPAAEQEACMSPESPFASILEHIMSLGGFPEASAVILYTSALAAIMSTTDSILISISQIITSDILYPMRPKATPKQVAWMGRFVSLVVSMLSLIVGLTWQGSILKLFDLGMPLSMLLVPPFLTGIFSKYRPHPWSLAIPTFGGIIAAIVIIIFWEHDALHDAIFVLLLTCGAMLLCEFGRLLWNRKLRFNVTALRNLRKNRKKKKEEDSDEADERDRQDPFPNRPDWDKPKMARFGDHSLSPKLLDNMMTGLQEPIKNGQYILLMCLVVTMTVPLTPESQPLLENGLFAILPATFRGLPWWAFKSIIITFLASLFTLPIIFSIPDDFPFDKDELLRSGIDADIVELEPEEKGRRTGYDEVNEALVTRRSMIRAETQRIKLTKKRAYETAEDMRKTDENANSACGHLENLVKEPTRRTLPVFESQWRLGDVSEGAREEEEEHYPENVEEEDGNGGEDNFEDNVVVGGDTATS